MGTSVYTSLLIKDFRRKAGNIKSVKKDLRELARIMLEMERELAALVTVIQSRDPSFTPHSVRAISTIPKILGLKWNRLSILVLEAIRVSETQPVHIQSITDYVICHGEINIENRKSRTAVYFSVLYCLKRLRKKEKVIHAYNKTKETEGFWTLPSNI